MSCAASIVGILTSFFPNSTDKLSQERGHFAGPAPALLHDTDPATLVDLMLQHDDVGHLEMGANQAGST